MSDLHIAGPDCPRQQAFLRFLRELGPVDRLCLCGDIFQHWWHWPARAGRPMAPLPEYAEVVEALRGWPLAVLPGNHDWHVHEFFGALGAQTPGPDGVLRTEWDGTPVALAHGDQADTSLGYGLLSGVLRGGPFRAAMDALSPERVWRFLGWLGGHGEVRENPDLIARQAAWARAQPEDIVIFGHTHAPSLVTLPGSGPGEPARQLVNIGDGVTHRTWVEYDSSWPERLRLREFADPLHPRA